MARGYAWVDPDASMPMTFLRTLLPAAALALATSVPAATRAAHEPPRPVVLLVHGRGQAARDTAELRRELLKALQAGTREVAGSALLGEDDVRLVWYADAVDPRSGDATGCSALAAETARNTEPDASPRTVLAALATAASALLDVVDLDASADVDARELRALFADVRYLG